MKRDLPLGRFPEPDVLRRRWISAHEGVVQLLVAGEDLPVHVALVVVPDAPALSRKHGADTQEKGHRAGLEDPPLRIHEGPALTFEHEPAGDDLMAENQIAALDAADVIERGLANDGVAGDQLFGCHTAAQRGRQYPGRV
jgi:hypothetical protein